MSSPALDVLVRLNRVGPYRIVKAHVEGRKYRVLVLDSRLPVGERRVYRAEALGWTLANRENAAAWALERCRAEGYSFEARS